MDKLKKKKQALLDKQKFIQRQSLPLEAKIQTSIRRIKDWIEYWDGEIYVAFSGGRDSTVLADLVGQVDKTIPLVFSDTGLEMPEIRDFVKKMALTRNVVRVRPKKTFKRVIEEDGFALVSKKVAKQVRVLKSPRTDKNARMWDLYNTGVSGDGRVGTEWKLPKKWRHLIESDVKISDKCCDHLKKQPLDTYAKESGKKPMTGMMAAEGGMRSRLTQCNSFDGKSAKSSPMLFWTEQDITDYIAYRNLEICEVYFEREVVQKDGRIAIVPPEKRTGCMFCLFGVHMEKEKLNRFQRMSISHPRHHETCISKLGLGKALDLIDVKYIPDDGDVKYK